jgi:hypothetical protein
MIKSNVPISGPILRPSDEDAHFNGFAWSHQWGMIHQSSNNEIMPGGDPVEWLGTQP